MASQGAATAEVEDEEVSEEHSRHNPESSRLHDGRHHHRRLSMGSCYYHNKAWLRIHALDENTDMRGKSVPGL